MNEARGLRFKDLEEWVRWQSQLRPTERMLRSVRHHVSPVAPSGSRLERDPVLYLPEGDVHTLVCIDDLTPSYRSAIAEPLAHFSTPHTAILAPEGLVIGAAEAARAHRPLNTVTDLPRGIRAVVSLGGYLALSAEVVDWAAERDIPFFIVQHGLLTPVAPPASPGAHVLAWTSQDADYWSAGRPDITTTVVGSQMLWRAGNQPPVQAISERPIVLGQLHGNELSRQSLMRAYLNFARRVPSDYRPHPNEADVVSRGLHAVMRRSGVTFESSGLPLVELGRPVVSIFSTGTLEVAQRGLPAWVTHPAPPAWVRDFWARYNLSPWGEEPTPAWHQPDVEPARAIAAIVEAA